MVEGEGKEEEKKLEQNREEVEGELGGARGAVQTEKTFLF